MTQAQITTPGSTLTSPFAAVARGTVAAVKAPVAGLAAIYRAWRGWRNRAPVMALMELDDRMLSDIGLTRNDVTSSLAAPLTQDPSARMPCAPPGRMPRPVVR